MPIPVQSPTRTTSNGNDVATVFNYGFKITNANQLRAEVLLADGTRTDGVSITNITGVGNNAGGAYTYNPGTPLPTGAKITAYLKAPLSQPNQITNQGNLYLQVIEQTLDNIELQVQTLNDQLGRSLVLPVNYAGSQISVELPETGKGLKWDAAGNLVNTTYNPDDLGSAAAEAEASAATAVEAAAQAELYKALGYGWIDPRDPAYAGGVKMDTSNTGSGGTNDSAAWQAAMDAAAAAGKALYVPYGDTLAGNLNVPDKLVMFSNGNVMGYGASTTGEIGQVPKFHRQGTSECVFDLADTSYASFFGINGNGRNANGTMFCAGGDGHINIVNCFGHDFAVGAGGDKPAASTYQSDGYCHGYHLIHSKFGNCGTGFTKPIDCWCIGSVFNANTTDVSMPAGSSLNHWVGNRFEWCNQYHLKASDAFDNVYSGNTFDRAGYACCRFSVGCRNFSFAANHFRRPGRNSQSTAGLAVGSGANCYFDFDDANSIVIVGNTFSRGIDDNARLKAITGITQANPAVITAVGHQIPIGTTQTIRVDYVTGMTEMNFASSQATMVATAIDADTLSVPVNSTGYTAYASGGYVSYATDSTSQSGGYPSPFYLWRINTAVADNIIIANNGMNNSYYGTSRQSVTGPKSIPDNWRCFNNTGVEDQLTSTIGVQLINGRWRFSSVGGSSVGPLATVVFTPFESKIPLGTFSAYKRKMCVLARNTASHTDVLYAEFNCVFSRGSGNIAITLAALPNPSEVGTAGSILPSTGTVLQPSITSLATDTATGNCTWDVTVTSADASKTYSTTVWFEQ